MIVGIDPGLRCTGVAIFDGDMCAVSVRPVSRDLLERVREILARVPWEAELAVIERPQVYRHGPGDPNDLIDLAVLVGAIASQFTGRVLLPRPAEWKGQVPKEIHHQRIRKRVPDLGRCSKDALDAVGLCLWGIDHA